tara:strand:- start:1098 stop:1469 length:372 start_codon:yes stop_codon:yes gene_type:complete
MPVGSWMDEKYKSLFPTSKGLWAQPKSIVDPLQRTGQGGLTFAKSPAKLLRGGVSSGASGASGVAAAGRTASQVAKAAGLWSAGLNFASKLFDKSKKGQPAPQTGVGKEQLTAGLSDWTQFFS